MAWGTAEDSTQLTLTGTYQTVQRSAADWEVTLNPGEIAQVMLDFNPQATPTENGDIIIARTADGVTYESDGEALRYIVEADSQGWSQHLMASGRLLRPRTQEGFDLLQHGRKPQGKLVPRNNRHAPYRILSVIAPEKVNLATGETLDVIGNRTEEKVVYNSTGPGFNQDDTALYRLTGNIKSLSGERVTIHCIVSWDAAAWDNTICLPVFIGSGSSGMYLRPRTTGLQLFTSEISVNQITQPKTYEAIHVSATFADGTLRYYIDGVLQSETTGLNNLQNINGGIFAMFGVATASYAGDQLKVHGVEIYESGWSESEVLEVHRDYFGTLYEPANDAPFLYSVPSGGASGDLAAQESGSDSASLNGSVSLSGTFAATETGNDVASLQGQAPVTISGDLSVAEIGADDASLTGAILVAGTLTVQEAGSDSSATTLLRLPGQYMFQAFCRSQKPARIRHRFPARRRPLLLAA